MIKKISVIGAGGWGTTLAIVLSEKNNDVSLWVREKELNEIIKRHKENKWFLRGIRVPDKIKVYSSLENVVKDADMLVVAVPSQFMRDTVKRISKYVKKGAIIINVAKGIEQGSYKRMSQILEEEIKDSRIVVLSGPNHCEEVSKKIPTATVIAGKQEQVLLKIKEVLETDYFKVYPHSDLIGTEICGAIKNITAIAIGVCDGLGLGDNAKGSIITLGLTEMNRFGRHFDAKRATFYGLAGVGDLVATCNSKLSRNRFVGEELAKGKSFDEIKKEMKGMVAEGVSTTKAVYEFCQKHDINMPLTNQIYKVLYENKELKKAIKDLITLI